MRLLHTKNLVFEEFWNKTPKYAILSHRWGKNEPSYQDFLRKGVSGGSDFAKIYGFCKFARRRDYSWVWIDSCCIDKTSSAELTESINSMWKWYWDAEECIVYLADVERGPHDWTTYRPGSGPERRLRPASLKVFADSAWWGRGWTLQELLAPDELVFCASDWTVIGDRRSLCADISKITTIANMYLERGGRHAIGQASVAIRMSWASKRTTTRTEDEAYCLMGIFGVNMPLLYGERDKAFLRLQMEIIKKSDDQSIFAWTHDTKSCGMLAPSPKAFRKSGNVVGFVAKDDDGRTPPYQMTNKGLEIRLLSAKSASIRCPTCRKNRAQADNASVVVNTHADVTHLRKFPISWFHTLT